MNNSVERFWSKVYIPRNLSGEPDRNKCWNWIANSRERRYGYFWSGTKYIGSHVFSYLLFNELSTIPNNQVICHSCDNTRCVNPYHLWLGTNKDNSQDAVAKGRMATGEKVGTSKLTESQVKQIKQLLTQGISQRRIAKIVNISQSTVSCINRNVYWRKV